MRSFLVLLLFLAAAHAQVGPYSLPVIDLADETHRQTIVDREPGQYLGHPSTLLLPDNRTILIAYPKGHGKGAVIYKKSFDGGRTWTERLPTPENWATSMETPTLYRLDRSATASRASSCSPARRPASASPTPKMKAIPGRLCGRSIRPVRASAASWR